MPQPQEEKQKEDEKRKNKSDDDSNNKNQDDDKPIWNSVMLYTLCEEDSGIEWGLNPMKHIFIGLSIIIILASIYTIPEIMAQIMLVLSSFWKLR